MYNYAYNYISIICTVSIIIIVIYRNIDFDFGFDFEVHISINILIFYQNRQLLDCEFVNNCSHTSNYYDPKLSKVANLHIAVTFHTFAVIFLFCLLISKN